MSDGAIAMAVINVLLGLVAGGAALSIRELKARVESLQADLSAYKVRVAEKYLTADTFILAVGEFKRDIENLRELITQKLLGD